MEHSTADLSKRLAQAQLEAQTGAEGCRLAETELNTVATRLKAEHAAALTSLKEVHMNVLTERQERLARDQAAKEARDGAKLLTLENRIEQLTQRLSETDSLNRSLEASVRELEAKLRSSETMKTSMESELGSSRAENMELRKTKHEQECVLNENRVRIAELAQELKGKAEAGLRQADLTCAANDHRAQLEKSMQGNEAQRLELQRIIATSAAEIQKGNGIIVRLQKEIAALHAKLDARSGVIIRVCGHAPGKGVGPHSSAGSSPGVPPLSFSRVLSLSLSHVLSLSLTHTLCLRSSVLMPSSRSTRSVHFCSKNRRSRPRTRRWPAPSVSWSRSHRRWPRRPRRWHKQMPSPPSWPPSSRTPRGS